jgi:hypothetical protein
MSADAAKNLSAPKTSPGAWSGRTRQPIEKALYATHPGIHHWSLILRHRKKTSGIFWAVPCGPEVSTPEHVKAELVNLQKALLDEANRFPTLQLKTPLPRTREGLP